MSTGPKPRPGTTQRGGARPGAGRKPIYAFSEKELKQLMKAARKAAKKHGKTVGDVLMEIVYCDNKRDAMSAIKIFYDNTVVRSSEKNVTVTESGPGIYLPQERPDPAKVVPIKQTG